MSRLILAAGVAALLLAACGGGSSGTAAIEPLNAPEKLLVGTYRLSDFSIREPRCAACTPKDFEAWSGELALNADRTASVRMEFCEQAPDPTAGCDRTFAWRGETGLIHLESLSTGEPDVYLEYEVEGMGAMATYSLLPTNDPEAGLLVLDAGTEELHWTRTE